MTLTHPKVTPIYQKQLDILQRDLQRVADPRKREALKAQQAKLTGKNVNPRWGGEGA